MARPDGFFDADLIARISRQELTARRLVNGFLAGKNRSNRHGHSVEFVEHREYSPGDDLRHLDWKVLGRMDRYYIKRYEEETNITAVLLVDASGSMTYGSGAMSKFELAAYAASALAYLLSRQRDAVGVALFDTEVRAFVPPSAKRVTVANIARQLIDSEPRGKTGLSRIVEQVSHDLPRRCLFIILSDFLVPAENVVETVKYLDVHGHDAIIVQTLDGAERTFPFGANVLFRGLEDKRELMTEPRRLRARYLELLEAHLAAIRQAAERVAYDYVLLSTDESIAPVLATALAARADNRAIVRRGVSS
jgi:uncharacterized protein (DUF58 family)